MFNEKTEFLELRNQIIEKEFSKMNNMQKKAVFKVDGPLLILAGAGSGKTTVLVNRIANIIKFGSAYDSKEISEIISENDIVQMKKYIYENASLPDEVLNKLSVRPCKPWRIMAITFTNKAAGELKQRLNSILGSKGNDVWSSTFHSLCTSILRSEAKNLGYNNNFTIYDTDDVNRLIKDIKKELDIDDNHITPKMISRQISKIKNQFLTFQEFKNYYNNPSDLMDNFGLYDIEPIFNHYQARLKEANAMDFDDLLLNTVNIFQKYPNVLEKYKSKFDYIMVDEYQDTNILQYRFVDLLANTHRNLCVVGDDDQSIYKFRGANIDNILNFEKEYKDATVIKLEQNYRSTQNILNGANSVIRNNKNRKSKMLWTKNPKGEKIVVHTSCSGNTEAEFIAKTIEEEVQKGSRYSDFAVLYRNNSQSNNIEKMLLRFSIPYRIVGGHRFYDRKEIKDIISYLSIINNTSDDIRLKRIINQPKRSIGIKTVSIATKLAYEHGKPLFEIIEHAKEYENLKKASLKFNNFCSMIQSFRSLYYEQGASISQLYGAILEKTRYIETIREEKDFDESKIQNIDELLNNIINYEYENKDEATLSGFLEEVSLITDIDNYDKSNDTVVLMTMHAAKGLEFPSVFLPGFEEGIFPIESALFDQNQLEEERRLAYVGMTRAKNKLYILNAESRMFAGKISNNKASTFISEIDQEVVEKTREKGWEKPKEGTIFRKTQNELKQRDLEYSKYFSKTYTVPKKNTFCEGEIVKHNIFGTGKVITCEPIGNDCMLKIDFDAVGIKRLMLNFSKITKL